MSDLSNVLKSLFLIFVCLCVNRNQRRECLNVPRTKNQIGAPFKLRLPESPVTRPTIGISLAPQNNKTRKNRLANTACVVFDYFSASYPRKTRLIAARSNKSSERFQTLVASCPTFFGFPPTHTVDDSHQYELLARAIIR